MLLIVVRLVKAMALLPDGGGGKAKACHLIKRYKRFVPVRKD
ncbi:hypothetical protein ACFLU4_05420 [Chloroflexota bacterium]